MREHAGNRQTEEQRDGWMDGRLVLARVREHAEVSACVLACLAGSPNPRARAYAHAVRMLCMKPGNLFVSACPPQG